MLLAGGPVPAKANSAAATLTSLESKAKAEHKNVLVVFHASWCGWCHKLDGLMTDSPYKDLFTKNYEVFNVDVMEHGDKKSLETPGGGDLLKQIGAETQGLPFFLAYNPQGKILMDSKNPTNIGFPSEPGEVEYFIKFLKATAPKVTDAELTSLKTYLSTKKAS